MAPARSTDVFYGSDGKIADTVLKYWTVDKSGWGEGAWQHEPDKKQWKDVGRGDATGYDCLIVRNRLGALCGYVGVPVGHPLYGRDYGASVDDWVDDSPLTEAELTPPAMWPESMRAMWVEGAKNRRVPYERRIDGVLDVHGGVTFARSCYKASLEGYEDLKRKIPVWQKEAEGYPLGDAARNLETWAGKLDRFEDYAAEIGATHICRVGDEQVWWFGFDCAHSSDLIPGMRSTMRDIMATIPAYGRDDVYRDIAYVEEQCAKLADQLKALEARYEACRRTVGCVMAEQRAKKQCGQLIGKLYDPALRQWRTAPRIAWKGSPGEAERQRLALGLSRSRGVSPVRRPYVERNKRYPLLEMIAAAREGRTLRRQDGTN